MKEITIGRGVVAWDGRVLETFGYGEASGRIHARTIEKITFAENKILGPVVTITVPHEGQTSIEIGTDEGQRRELEALFKEVQEASGGGF